MKYNIRKYDGGGLVSFTPIINSGGQQTAVSAPQQEQSKPLLDEEFYKELLKEDQLGLVNDVNYFVDQLDNLQSDPLSFLSSDHSNRTLKLIGKVNELKRNKELWSQAVDKSSQSGALSEVAVGTYGELYVKGDKGQIQQVSLAEYKNNSDKYKPLTNSELLNARQYDPQLVFNKSLFTVVENGIGLEKINDHISSIISSFGKETQSQESYQSKELIAKKYSAAMGIKQPTQEQLDGIREISRIADSVGPDGVYKLGKSISTQRGHVKEALNYIWGTLGKNAQDKLKAVAVMNGGNPSDVQTMLLNAIVVGTDYEETNKIDLDQAATSASGLGGGKEQLRELSDFEMFISGKLDQGESFEWNDPQNSNLKMSIPSTGRLKMTSNGKPVGMTTLSQINNTDLGQVSDINKVTFGGKKVAPWDLDKIVYDGGTQERVLMPLNNDKTPNFELLRVTTEAQNEVAKHPDWSAEDINRFYRERGLQNLVQVNRDKKIITNEYLKPFVIFHAYSTDQAEVAQNNKNIEKLSSDEENKVDDMLTPIFKTLGVSKPTGTFGTWSTDYYKGIVAYPLLDDASPRAAAIKGHMYDNKYTIEDVRVNMAKQEARPVVQGTANLLK